MAAGAKRAEKPENTAFVSLVTDGSEPTESSIQWHTPVVCNAPLIIAKAFYLGKESVTTVLFNR